METNYEKSSKISKKIFSSAVKKVTFIKLSKGAFSKSIDVGMQTS